MTVILAVALILSSQEFDPRYNKFIIVGGLVGTIFAYGLPRLILSSIASKRRLGIENAFPDALDMIAMSVDGGLPIQDAVRRVSEEFKPAHRALSKELLIISRQTDTGSVQQAMSSFAERIDMPEIGSWAALMSQSQRLGGKMAEPLLQCADRMRHNRKTRAEQAGNTASIKLLIPTVLCLAPPVFILLIGPAALDFKDFINRERDESTQLVEQANNVPGLDGRPLSQSRNRPLSD
jgi:tight adherence protein C